MPLIGCLVYWKSVWVGLGWAGLISNVKSFRNDAFRLTQRKFVLSLLLSLICIAWKANEVWLFCDWGSCLAKAGLFLCVKRVHGCVVYASRSVGPSKRSDYLVLPRWRHEVSCLPWTKRAKTDWQRHATEFQSKLCHIHPNLVWFVKYSKLQFYQ